MDAKKRTIIRIAIAAVAVVNAIAAMVGLPQLAIDQSVIEVVYEAASAVLLVGGSAWVAWKNNSITPAAITADSIMDLLRKGMGLLEAAHELVPGEETEDDERP